MKSTVKITKTRFNGVRAVELKTAALRLVAVYQYGPRIAFFGQPGGDNLFLWAPEKYKRGEWNLRGGHRVWVTKPGADECEDTYAIDNDACHVELFSDGFCLTGAENATNRTRRGFAVKALAADRLEVDNFVTNTGDMLYSGGVWALTCTLPGKTARYGVPIGDGSNWDVFKLVMFRSWAGHGQGGYNDPQISFTKDMLVVTPQGMENKRMVQAHHGIIAMSDPGRGLTFAKKVGFDAAGQYPLGTNIAVYIGPKNFMVEMETMGPEKTLKPGETLNHPEIWTLRTGAVDLTNAAAVCKLF